VNDQPAVLHLMWLFADQRHVRLLRGSEVTVYDVRRVRKDPSQDVRLRPGDKIEVPQSFF